MNLMILTGQNKGVPEMCVPSDTLKVEGVPPEKGDSVSFTVDGRVTRDEAGKLYVKPLKINGQPVEAQEPAEGDEADMDRMAEEADKEEGGF